MSSFGAPKKAVETSCVIDAGNLWSKVWHDSPWMPSGLGILFALSGASWTSTHLKFNSKLQFAAEKLSHGDPKLVFQSQHFSGVFAVKLREYTLWEHTFQKRKYSKVFTAENSLIGVDDSWMVLYLEGVGLDSEACVHKNQHQGCHEHVFRHQIMQQKIHDFGQKPSSRFEEAEKWDPFLNR